MLVSGFTFIKNGEILGYPFIESINSILPIVDEFVIAVGESEDDTLNLIKSINSPKIRVYETSWNENMRDRGYVYGQQKMIAQFNCKSKWAFYLEGDEIVHEDDLTNILNLLQKYQDDDEVEAIAFDYLHFYGNSNTYLNSPAWYRQEVRIIKNSIRTYAPDGLFWLVLDKNRVGRYPKAVVSGAKIYHYGWVRDEAQMNLKSQKVQKYWNKSHKAIDYKEIDFTILREFKGSHPKVLNDWLIKADGLFEVNINHKLTKREKRHRLISKIENLFGFDLSKKHFKLIKK